MDGGVFQQLLKGQQAQAVTAAERALALDPNRADLYLALGDILSWTEQPEKALRWYEQALRLNPRSPVFIHGRGWGYLRVGRYEEALPLLKKTLILNPNFPYAHMNLAFIYGELGREEEARAEVAEVQRLIPNVSLEIARQRFPSGDPVALERFLAALRKAGLK